MFRFRFPFGLAIASILFALPYQQLYAQTPGVEPFPNFVAGLEAAHATGFVGARGAAVSTPSDFEQMRQHLLSIYGAVSVSHSYLLDQAVFDCVPILQQPGLRLQGETIIPEPPSAPPSQAQDGNADQTDEGQRDAFGNLEACKPGEIPMRRITLEELTRFRTLADFFRKTPADKIGDGIPPEPITHKYAYEFAPVNNYGGWGYLNVWNPNVDTSLDEIFSLSQHWYSGGTGTNLQTAEVGWQDYPQKYSVSKPVLFVYWTADAYNKTGCYNLECAGFVQTDSSYHLGGRFTNYSKAGGTQYEIGLGYYFYYSSNTQTWNWWMAAGSIWVGYYPAKLYKHGQLSKYADQFILGGETTGAGIWPPMGSGKFGGKGYGHAAYHRDVLYRDSSNNGYIPTLYREQPSPSCYRVGHPNYSGSDWTDGAYFFFGGPGGSTC